MEVIKADVRWARGHAGTVGAHEAVVGDVAAAQLDLPPVDTRPTVLINGTPFAVVGVMTNTQREVDMLTSVMISLDNLNVVTGDFGMDVLINTVPGAAPQVARQAPLAVDPVAPGRMSVNAPPDPQGLRADIEGDVQAALVAVTAVALLAALVSIANAASTSVAERTSEFGLRRALGARPRHILSQVSLEVTLTGLLGGIVGLYVGLLAVLGMTITRGWQPVLNLDLIPLAVVAGAVTGAVGGFAAAVRAGRVQPVDALRR